MKPFFTLAIIALSIQAFAQFDQSASTKKLLISNSVEKAYFSIMNEVLQTHGIGKPEKNINLQLQNTGQQLITEIPDSSYSWSWDKNISGWKNTFRRFFDNDANFNLTSHVGKLWNGSQWVNNYRILYTFDANNNVISDLWQPWKNNNWQNSEFYTYTYDINNNMTSFLRHLWRDTTWLNNYITYYTYNPNNTLDSTVDISWVSNIEQKDLLKLYIYDSNNNLTTNLIKRWDGNMWADSELHQYTYDANNKLIEDLHKVNVTIDFERTQYTYDLNNKTTSIIIQKMDNNVWRNSEQQIYTYDNNNNVTGLLVQKWFGAWTNSSLVNDTYNANNNIISSTTKIWDFYGTAVTSYDSAYVYYHTITTGLLKQQETNISIYPNPSKDKITLSSEKAIDHIEIYNSLGNRIYFDSGSEQQLSHDIDLTGFPKGIYFIKTYIGTKSNTKKLVIQ